MTAVTVKPAAAARTAGIASSALPVRTAPSRLCENKRKTDKLLTSGEYLLVSTEDYTQLMDDMITLADLIDELCRMHMEKYTLSQQFRELSSIMSEDEALFVLNAKRMNELIDERWGNTELIPVDIK